MKSKLIRYLALILTVASLSCDPHTDNYGHYTSKAEEIRALSERGEVERIYSDASEDFKRTVSINELRLYLENRIDLMQKSENRVLANVTTSLSLNQGKLTVLTYRANYDGRTVLEQFVFLGERNQVHLFRYTIDYDR